MLISALKYATLRCALLFACGSVLVISASAAHSQQPEKPSPRNTTQQKPHPPATEPEKKATIPPSEAPQVLQQLNSALQNLATRVSPAVVQILVTGYGPLESKNSSESNTAVIVRQHAIGSGVIVDPSGYIMTNAHVVEGARRVRVVLPAVSTDLPLQLAPVGKSQVFDAKVIGVHKEIDLALIKVNANTSLPTLALATARRVRQGQLVFAIGSPEGLQSTVTMGIVSSVARQPDPDKPYVYIQTDAPINPGNSGGPLVDMEGYVVGLNTFILSEAGGSEGLGFAIPARVVKFVYENLRKYGHVHRSVIGAVAQTITPTLAAGLGLAQNYGVIISDVKPDGPAEAAGLKIGDIVLTADDRRVETLPVFTASLYLHPADQVLKLDVLRGAENKTLYIAVLEEKDQMDRFADLANVTTDLVPQLAILGVSIDDGIRSLLPDLRRPSGVIVLGRAADLIGPDTGLSTGDIIHSLNRAPIDSIDGLRTVLKPLKTGDAVTMQVEREGHLRFVSFEME